MDRWLAFVCAVAAFGSCHLAVRDYQAAAGGGGGGGGGGAGASGGGGGTGGASLDGLNDDGLIVRYFLDEAPSGRDPVNVLDHAQEPLLNLNLTYGTGGSGGWLEYGTEPEGRGLVWPRLSLPGRAATSLTGSKLLSTLSGTATSTLELVMRADELNALASTFVRMYGQGGAAGGPTTFGLALTSQQTGRLRFHVNGVVVGAWNLGLTPRKVIHVVINTELEEPSERVQLYDNGLKVANTSATPPAMSQVLDFGTGATLILGNSNTADQNFVGVLSYAAVYETAMPKAQVAHNAAILLVDDDAPE